MIDWDEDVGETLKAVKDSPTINFMQTTDFDDTMMEAVKMYCRECGKVLGNVITTSLDNMDFECGDCDE
jgi:hypothetical protein